MKDVVAIALHLAALSRSEWWSATRVENYQRKRLIRILRHAVSRVPYYRSLGIDPKSIRLAEDLQRFPLLTKSLVQIHGEALLADGCSASELRQSRTSGSTGEPTITYFDNRAWLVSKYALKIRRMMSNGVGLFKHVVVVSEQSPEELKEARILPGSSTLFRHSLLSIHRGLDEHALFLSNQRADAIYGYPSYFAELIAHCKAQDISLAPIPVVFTSSEVLRPEVRRSIEDFFSGRVCDVYGSTEFKEVAWQCGRGRYHLNSESVWAESVHLPEIAHGQSSTLVLTSLLNEAMPLIRYQQGDVAEVRRTACACGRSSPVLENIGGREVDLVELPDGRRVSPYLLTTAIEQAPQISRYQVIQLALDRLEVTYIGRSTVAADSDFQPIIEQMRRYLGDGVAVTFRRVDEIARTVRGKHRVLVRAAQTEDGL